MLSTTGERISYCRGMLGFTRDKFIEKFGTITLSTLARWELNTINIPEPKLKLLYNFFTKNGLLLKLEWLRYGEGTPPVNIAKGHFKELNFDEIVYSTLTSVTQKSNNFKFYQINNNLYEPLIRFGDYIGGTEVSENFSQLHNKFCYLISEFEIVIGNLNHDSGIISFGNYNYKFKNIKLGGEITWIARRP